MRQYLAVRDEQDLMFDRVASVYGTVYGSSS